MIRYIKKLEFDVVNKKILITDNVESWTIEGTIDGFCPKIHDRWMGYLDKVKNDYDKARSLGKGE